MRFLCQAWARRHHKAIEYVAKGSCALTEHYSALRADVLVPSDPSTGLNEALLADLRKADRVIVCGQALSHCVNFTVRDLVEHWPEDQRARIVVLEDCSSPVPGFDAQAAAFVDDMRALGVTVTTSTEVAFP